MRMPVVTSLKQKSLTQILFRSHRNASQRIVGLIVLVFDSSLASPVVLSQTETFPFLNPTARRKVQGVMAVAATGAEVGMTISAFVSVSAAETIK